MPFIVPPHISHDNPPRYTKGSAKSDYRNYIRMLKERGDIGYYKISYLYGISLMKHNNFIMIYNDKLQRIDFCALNVPVRHGANISIAQIKSFTVLDKHQNLIDDFSLYTPEQLADKIGYMIFEYDFSEDPEVEDLGDVTLTFGFEDNVVIFNRYSMSKFNIVKYMYDNLPHKEKQPDNQTITS